MVGSLSLACLQNKLRNINATDIVKVYDDGSRKQREHLTRRKSRFELVRICVMIAGIELCYAAETAFVSPIMLRLHVPYRYMTLTWCLSPILGLILTPLLGSLSDRCRSRLGRRRPFLIAYTAVIVIGLALVANSHDIGLLLGDTCRLSPNNVTLVTNHTRITTDDDVFAKNMTEDTVNPSEVSGGVLAITRLHCVWGVLFTVIGVLLLDFSCDASQSPARTYLLDICIPEDHKAGLTMFTVVSGIGGAIGYLLGAVNWGTVSKSGESFMSHVRIIFTVVLILLIALMGISITSFAEISLTEIEPKSSDVKTKKSSKSAKSQFGYEEFTDDDSDDSDNRADAKIATETTVTQADTDIVEKRTFPLPTPVTEETDLQATLPGPVLESEVSLKMYLISIIKMPKSLVMLCVTNLFSWMSLLCYSLYFTDYVGQVVFGGLPTAPDGSEEQELYAAGVRFGSGSMSLYSLSCSLYSLTIEYLVVRFGAKKVYVLSLLSTTIGMILMSLMPSRLTVIILSPSVGIIYAALFTMPYIILANYHSNQEFGELLEKSKSGRQVRGLGTDVAVVGSMVFVGQCLLSACMGSIIHAVGTTAVVVWASALFSLLAAISAFGIKYIDM
ncbi:membrane-associated transporter protein-like [Tubulanus polymorphus]|uniref:membrane-associated transporter protein-like n=1 Tax=Tubulanus polymorphus TaxID=672921 RepID=UPI003DA44859